MKTKTTYTNVEVDITINEADALSLERHGEILAHPENSVAVGIVKAEEQELQEAYDDEQSATCIAITYTELRQLVTGEKDEISWTCGRAGDADDPHVTLSFEVDV